MNSKRGFRARLDWAENLPIPVQYSTKENLSINRAAV